MKAAVSISILLAVSSLGCRRASVDAVEWFRPEELLRNMPVNSDFRCTGITLVGEALLGGKLLADGDCDRPEDLGRRIFQNAGTNSIVYYRSKLCLDHGSVPIQSREALDRLSTEVANLYKQRHMQLIATEEGRRKIVAGQQAWLRSDRELDAILDADSDQAHAFMAIGIRQFPDATEKETYHVVIIARRADGKKVIYDPNDPGAAVPCQLQQTPEGLLAKWTCKYKDTGQVTTQEYLIVDRQRFFELALNP